MDYTALLYHTPRKNSKVFMQKVVERSAPARPFGGGKPARPFGGGKPAWPFGGGKPAQKQKKTGAYLSFFTGGDGRARTYDLMHVKHAL